jgi:hypothetical protein
MLYGAQVRPCFTGSKLRHARSVHPRTLPTIRFRFHLSNVQPQATIRRSLPVVVYEHLDNWHVTDEMIETMRVPREVRGGVIGVGADMGPCGGGGGG